ncbi:tetratricopeptide repeat protein [Mucilaginibacter mali]|uniref:Tetratricopeptide repeat protein n=1 Tax=Mucilaginibacter mali TaxID=2740462 RepID=A0A7D4Q8V3_9SPHI|nr:tetratricopeptide repeat protein [Mucilaginibacter mali]QKJ30971.1 tetratricopeptide repeat protein [Mucilaginibacter mali]
MKRASTLYSFRYLAFTVLASLLAIGCSLEKESGFNRTMQNLTAHYNILFNANDLLRQKQEVYQTSYIDAYNQLLSVYQDTAAHPNNAVDKELEAAITKANTIISVKEQSHYIGDAYLVLGKANHLYGHYFNAIEFFRYVTLSFPKQKALVQEARVWQARSAIYLNQMDQAKELIDSTIKNVNPKKSITGDVYGTALQYHMNMGEYTDAEAMAKLAVKYANTKQERLRRTFILAQLQELNREQQDAYQNYSKVVKSNASFEMAFNADLNRIRLEDEHANRSLTRMERLKRLLRDDKNVDFTDQIYYQIGLLYLAGNDIDNAIKNFQLSVRYSTKNQNQKGLSYLRLADISFKNQGNYVKAKKYYDSTLLNLSPTYPDYTQIQKKNNNLQVLADRLQIIGHEDTLQTLAKLDEKDRNARIEEMVNRHTQQLQASASAIDPLNNAYTNSIAAGGSSATGTSSFYFYNSASIANGYASFKRVWGNRKLEDNWRRSRHISGDAVAATPTQFQNADPDAVATPANSKTVDEISSNNYKQELLQNLPLTPQKLDQSNQRVYNAYTDIANFYRDILDDKKEAIEAYQTLLTRYPNDPNKPAVFYSLYRLYFETGNAVRADEYKNRLLKDYASSIYAQVITDPDYSKRIDDRDAGFNLLYNQVYDLYAKRKYADVINKADSLLRVYPGSKFAAQLNYLRAISNGHKEKFDPFRSELLAITQKYPNDRLITPLINQHIVYLEENKAKMSAREFALMDNDPSEEPFIPATVPSQPVVKAPVQNQPQQKPVVQNQQPVKQTITPPANNNPVTQQQVPPPVNNPVVNNTQPPAATNPAPGNPSVTPTAPAVKSIFSLKDSTNYYFVVNVSTGTVNLSSSRFGIGQFNRANYQGTGISHQLKNAGDNNQLVYVGRFNNITAVKNYARAIIPLMPQIMKVPADKYTFFIITQENLDKLADKKTLDSYIDFYQKNY